MLVQLGKRPVSEDVVDLLLECHGRIRRFLVMGRQLAQASNASVSEIVATAAQIRRYFAEAFPLHVADEECDIAPRLASMVGNSVVRMEADHRAQSFAVAELIVQCGIVEREPDQHAAVCARLHAVVVPLAADLETHMEFEERTLFPALRNLPQHDQDAILAAMRQRRSRVLAGVGQAESAQGLRTSLW